jgi:predicted DNA-binding transcriptional regulator AlpA
MTISVMLGVTPASGSADTLAGMPTDLIGLNELADLLGVTKMTASRYANRDDFPAPVLTPKRGRLWSQKQVERWSKKTQLPRSRYEH